MSRDRRKDSEHLAGLVLHEQSGEANELCDDLANDPKGNLYRIFILRNFNLRMLYYLRSRLLVLYSDPSTITKEAKVWLDAISYMTDVRLHLAETLRFVDSFDRLMEQVNTPKD